MASYVTVNAGGSYDNVRIYYEYTAGTNGHTVYVWATYEKSAGNVSMGAQSGAYLTIAGTTVATGQAAQNHGSGSYTLMPSGGGKGSKWISHNAATSVTITYNVYLLNGSYTMTGKSGSFSVSLPYVAPPYSKMGAPTIKTSASTAKRGTGTAMISWTAGSLGNSSVKEYVVTYGTNSNANSWTFYSGGTGTSKVFTMPAAVSVGTTYYFKAMQKSNAGSSYDSAYGSTVSVKATSNGPTISIVSSDPASKIIPYNGGSGGIASFVISAKNNANTGTPTISQTSGWTRDGTTISRTLSGVTEGETYTCSVTASDGYETSSAVTITFTINTVPTIAADSVAFSIDAYNGVLGSGIDALVRSFSLSQITPSEPVNGYYLYYKDLSTDEIIGINDTEEALNTQHFCSNVPGLEPNIVGNHGKTFALGAQVYDGYDRSEIQWEDMVYQVPRAYGDFTNISWGKTSGEEIEILDGGKINVKLTPTWTNPGSTEGVTNLTDITCHLDYKVNSVIDSSVDYPASQLGLTRGQTITYSQGIPINSNYRGQVVDIYLVATDEAGNRIQSNTGNYTIITLPSWSSTTTLTPSTDEFFPSGDVDLSLSNTGYSDTNSATIYYYFYCPSKNVTISLGSEARGQTTPFIHETELDVDNNPDLATSENYWNSTYTDGYFQAYLEDAFGNRVGPVNSATVTVDYQKAPVISSSTIYVVYDQDWTSGQTIDTSTNAVVFNNSGKVVIPYEKIAVTAAATDANNVAQGKESLTYKLLYQTSDTSTFSTQTWKEAYSTTVYNTNQQTLYFTFSPTNSQVFYKFKLEVTDSTGKTAVNEFQNRSLSLVPVTIPPVASFQGEYIGGNDLEVSLTYTLTTPSSPEWTNNRWCPSPSGWSTSYVIKLEKSTTGGEGTFEDITPSSTTSPIVISQTSNLYYRLTATYNTGKKGSGHSTISTISKIILVYIDAPLISYRNGCLGINYAMPAVSTSSILMRIEPSQISDSSGQHLGNRTDIIFGIDSTGANGRLEIGLGTSLSTLYNFNIGISNIYDCAISSSVLTTSVVDGGTYGTSSSALSS